MRNWKHGLMVGAGIASAILFLKGKTAAGAVCAGVGVAVLATEYPDEFAEFRERIPEYVERGSAFLDVAARVGERVAEAAAGRSQAWRSLLSE